MVHHLLRSKFRAGCEPHHQWSDGGNVPSVTSTQTACATGMPPGRSDEWVVCSPHHSRMEMVMFSITKSKVSSLGASPSELGGGQAECRPSMKILVVDEHFLIRDALCAVIKELKNDATVLEAADGRQTMQLVSEQRDIALVLLELDLPDRDGMSVLRELRERHPAISVVVLSARQERASVAKALGLGALGFIPKSQQREVMLSALNLVFAGGVYIPPEILSHEERSYPNLHPACI